MEVLLEKAGQGEQHAGKRGGAEPVALVGQNLGAMRHVELCQAAIHPS